MVEIINKDKNSPSLRPPPQFEGPLRVQAAGFGFVGDVFVAAPLITKHGLVNGQLLKGTAEAHFDQKKGKDGWMVKKSQQLMG